MMRLFVSEKPLMRANLAVCAILMAAVVLLLSGRPAAATIQFTEIGRWGGMCTAVSVSGDRAYVGMGASVIILDVSDPDSPVRLGTANVPTTSTVSSIDVSGSYAYILVSQAGLYVVDVSDPDNPLLTGFYRTDDFASEVVVSGNCAYIAKSCNLEIIDISDPSRPTRAGSYPASTTCYSVAISGSYAYITDSATLMVIDVSNPSSPTRVGSLARVYAVDIAVSGNRLYSASRTTNGFRVFDISSPAAPVQLGTYDTPGDATGVSVDGDYAYVGDSYSGLHVLDVSNPASPSLMGTLDTVDSAGRSALLGNLLLLSDSWNGMRAIDVSNPSAPTEAWACDGGKVRGIAISGNTLYAACTEDSRDLVSSQKTLDASNPQDIKQIGRCSIPSSGNVAMSGGFTWVSGNTAGLHIVDVSAPASPVKTATYDSPGYAMDVAWFGHYACVADGQSGIHIIDVADPASPVRVGGYDTAGSAYAVEVSGNYAYVADMNRGMLVISLADPASPNLVATYPVASDAWDIEILGNIAYLAVGRDGLEVLDITNPAAPVRIGMLSHILCSNLVLSGNYLYTSYSLNNGGPGAVLDVTDPAHPVFVGRAPFGWVVAVSADRVYTASNDVLKLMQAAQSDLCIIHGYVKDSSGKPLSGIAVSSEPGGHTLTTDLSGHYELDYADPGSYTFSASGAGWVPASVTLTAANGQVVQAADIVLACGILTGCVSDDLGNPVPNVTVSATSTISTVSDANGNYKFDNLAPGYYNVSAQKEGYISATHNVSILGAQTAACDFTLVRAGTITGFVKDNLGRPIYGISVISLSSNYSTSTDANGAYTLSGITPGTYSIIATNSSWTPVTKSNIVVAGHATVTLDFTLQLGTISGTVKDKAGSPISGATVSFSNGTSTTTGANGSYTFANISPANYSLTASKAGYQQATVTARVTGGLTSRSNFALTAYGTISGTVTDKAGRPLGGAQLSAQYSCHTYTATSDTAGHYSIPDVFPDSNITLTALKTGYAEVIKTLSVSENQNVVCNYRLGDAIGLELVSNTHISYALYEIAVSDGLAIVDSTDGTQYIDVSNPASPVKLATVGHCSDVLMFGNYAYTVGEYSGLEIVDVSDPAAPVIVGSCGTPGTGLGIDVVGDYAYVADGASGLQIIDISNPANPAIVGACGSASAGGVAVSGGYACVANDSGLKIIDVRNPASPTAVGTYSGVDYSFDDVAVSGNYAYAVDSYRRLFHVVDISVPANPVLAGKGYLATNSSPIEISISGNYAYVASGYYTGLLVYDISSPTSPGLVGQYKGCSAVDVAVSNGYIYVADGYGKFLVLSPEHLKITAVAPNKAANTETALVVSLKGLGFTNAVSVKLTRAGQPDINATEVTVKGATEITCKLNLSSATPGFWDVVVTNSDGLSYCLQGGFMVLLPDSAPCVAATNRSTKDAVTAAACSGWRFKLFGNVTQTAPDGFLIDDGSGAIVRVYGPGYTQVAAGDYVAVTGTLDVSSDQAVLISTDAQIDKLR